MNSEQWTTTADVARAYGVTEATIREWCASGAIQGAIHAGRAWRIPIRYASGTVPIDLTKRQKGGSNGGGKEK